MGEGGARAGKAIRVHRANSRDFEERREGGADPSVTLASAGSATGGEPRPPLPLGPRRALQEERGVAWTHARGGAAAPGSRRVPLYIEFVQ